MEAAVKGFHIVDYLIFSSVLAISLIIGLYHAFTGGKQKTTKEFFMANRELRTLPVALSILVSFISAIIVLGTPAEMYTRGTQLTMRVIGYCIACVLSSLLFVPLFFGLKITSTFEYLERRFQSKGVRRLGSLMMLVGNLFYMGLLMYTPSTALEAEIAELPDPTATGFPLWGSIVATGVVSTVYTTVGGMKAVIWTDVFQGCVMLGGMLAIVIVGTTHVGGMANVWNLSQKGGRLIWFNFSIDPSERLNFWSVTIGGMFTTLTIFGIGQSSVQRYCALPTLTQAKWSVFLNIPGLILVNVLASLVGLVMYAYYAAADCDPLRNGYISSSNQLVPYFVIDVLNYPGFAGIFLAVLFSGALSSMSSCLNSAAAVTWEDGLKNFFSYLKEDKKAFITKIVVCVYGGLAMIVSGLASHLGGHVLQASLSFTGATMGPSLGMFMLGAFFPVANKKGAISGCLVSTAFSLWLAIGSFIYKPHRYTQLPTSIQHCANTSVAITANFTNTMYNYTVSDAEPPLLKGMNRFYGISFLWYSAIGVAITLIVGITVSLITRDPHADVPDDSLLIPVLSRLCCCCCCCYSPTRGNKQNNTMSLSSASAKSTAENLLSAKPNDAKLHEQESSVSPTITLDACQNGTANSHSITKL